MTRIEPVVSAPRLVHWWVAAVVLSAFGPYIVGGVRTEQIMVYGSAVFVLTFGASILATGAPWARPPALILGLWGALLVVALIGAAWPDPNGTGYEHGSALAGLDSLALPAALTGNRTTTLVWVLAGLLVASRAPIIEGVTRVKRPIGSSRV